MTTPPIYEPPYDSPIEDKFAYNFVKYADQDSAFVKQHNVKTICGNFIVDFLLITKNGKRIGIECDGKEFHDSSRDEWRDAMILGDNHLDIMYRINGDDIYHQLENVLYLMAKIDPYIFTERGRINLKTLSSRDDEKYGEYINLYSPSMVVSIEDSDNTHRIQLTRRCNTHLSGRTEFCKIAYEYAKQVGGGNLDEVIEKYRNKN